MRVLRETSPLRSSSRATYDSSYNSKNLQVSSDHSLPRVGLLLVVQGNNETRFVVRVPKK
jgi:hypothetical protein